MDFFLILFINMNFNVIYNYIIETNDLYKDYYDKDTNIDYNNIIKFIGELELVYWHYIDIIIPTTNQPKIKFIYFIYNIMQNKEIKLELYQINNFLRIYNKYKKTIPTAGAIILYKNNILLVKIKGSYIYGIPKGKKMQYEKVHETAIREVKEETGVDISNYITDKRKYIKLIKSKIYIINFMEKIEKFENYDKREIEEVKWFDFKFIYENPDLFTKQVKIYINENYNFY